MMEMNVDFLKMKYQQNIVAELVKIIYSQATPAIIASLIAAAGLVYVLYDAVPKAELICWYAVMCIVLAVRYSLLRYYLHHNQAQQDSWRWEKYFVITTFLMGLNWAFVSTWLMPASSIHQTFIISLLAAVAAASVPFLASSRLACCSFIIPMLLPFAIWSMLQPDVLHAILGLLTLVYLSFLLVSCFRIHAAVYGAVKLKLDYAELVKQLTATQHEMAIVNQTLQTEINFRAITEKLLRDSEEQYRLVTDALPVLISYVDTSLRYRFINKAYTDWFGEEVDTIIGKSMRRVIGDSAFVIFKENIANLPNRNVINFETIMNFRNQEERYVSVSLIPHIVDGEFHGFFSLISDMTPRINFLATHDALTSLPNRSLFTAKFSQALKHAQFINSKLALFFLDLDHFKNINDTLGHDAGDILLKKVAERISDTLGDKDMLARLGGDEFIILLEMINSEDIINTATQICEVFVKPFNLNGEEVYITTSLGISVYPEDGQEMQILLKNADMATYRAKERGRNTFEFYTEEMNKIILNKIHLESKLHQAIEKEQFLLHYQPVMDIPSNSITSMEALLRWDDPEKGLVYPQDFINVAEETGLIIPIGVWVFGAVCKQNALWQKHANFPVKLRISVNLSARQFNAKNLLSSIRTLLKETNLSGEYITVELTETLIMQDIGYSGLVMKELKDLGISISIDDFGTGYSSLNYLRRFPIDILKIDKSFIADVTNKTDEAAIVNAIIAMAHSLKMKVIAEGVENLGQYYFLKESGCDEMQGFLLSKPMPPQEIEVFLKHAFSVEEYLNKQSLSSS
jgi:diguanylate cyclase (GGDEF)-like protein/PAS domain S-box-containing protein